MQVRPEFVSETDKLIKDLLVEVLILEASKQLLGWTEDEG